jgi:tetratricopeptide (TPR) repeat protein
LMLKVASVIGRIFALRTLHDIHPVATDRTLLSGYLDHLRALDITPLEAPAPNEAYIFRHIITHEVAYNLLLFQQRRDLHRIVADWYERVFGEDLSPHYPLLAHHWRIAEDAEKQIKYLELSGENALRNGAYRESIVFFLELIALNERSKLVDDAVRIAHWERALGEAYFSTGDFSRSKRYHVLAVKRLGRPFSPNAPGLILQLLGEAIRQVLHRYFPSRFVGTITDPALVERYLEGARAYERISHIVYFENNTFGTVAAGIASLNLSERVAASPESVRAYGTTQVTTGLMGMHNASLSYERLAKESSEAVRGQPGFLAAEGWRLMMAGTYHAGAGSLQTAIAAMDDAIAIWETLGEKQRWKESLSLVSTMNVYHSDLETAYRRIEQFYQAALQEQNEQFRFWALLTRAMALRREGKLEDADAALKAAVSGEIVLAPSDQIWHGGVLARVLLGLGQFDLAKKEADTAADLIAASQPTAYYVLTGYSAVIEVYLAGMEQDLAKRGDYQKRAWKMIGKLKAFSTPFPIAKTRLHLLLGRYHALSAKTSAVLPALHKSLEHAETFSLRYDRAQAHLELSKYVRDHEERRKHRQAAEALFAEAGAESEAKQIVVE